MTTAFIAGHRKYTLEEVYETGRNHGENLVAPYPPENWGDRRPDITTQGQYWLGYRQGLRDRWSPVYLVQCVTYCLQRASQRDTEIRNRDNRELRKELADEIRVRRNQGMHTAEDNRESFRRIKSKDHLAVVPHR